MELFHISAEIASACGRVYLVALRRTRRGVTVCPVDTGMARAMGHAAGIAAMQPWSMAP